MVNQGSSGSEESNSIFRCITDPFFDCHLGEYGADAQVKYLRAKLKNVYEEVQYLKRQLQFEEEEKDRYKWMYEKEQQKRTTDKMSSEIQSSLEKFSIEKISLDIEASSKRKRSDA